MRIQIVTAKGYRNEIDLLSDEVLRPFGKTKKDVWSVRWSDHFSDSVYTELDLASPRHPLIGSGSATMCFAAERWARCRIFFIRITTTRTIILQGSLTGIMRDATRWMVRTIL